MVAARWVKPKVSPRDPTETLCSLYGFTLYGTVAGLQTTQKRRTAGLLSIVHASYFCAHLDCLVSVRARYFGKFWLTTCKFEPWVTLVDPPSPVFGASHRQMPDRRSSPPCDGQSHLRHQPNLPRRPPHPNAHVQYIGQRVSPRAAFERREYQ